MDYAKIALTVWLIPLACFTLLALTHKRGFMPKVRDKIATGAMGVCLALSVYMLIGILGGHPIAQGAGFRFEWFRMAQDRPVVVGMMIDNLGVIMLVVVTLVSFLVHLFSMGYLQDDVRYGRYYCGLQIFSMSMIGLVLADNFLLLYCFWELVGLSSYLLIGHWFEKKSASDAAIKAFITTRIGDVGMFLGILLIYAQVGSFAYTDVFAAVADGTLSGNLLTLAGLGIFFGAVGKSAQFPLHVWLPDAMEGPTPVSALIHAATMVAAGVYLVGRVYPMFDPTTFLVIAYTGGITCFFAATIALVQDDIKKVLAYSTVSQLGYMMLGLGVGGYVAGLFHLTTHAFFKACLFLGSGSVIYAMHHEQRMSQYGGLWRKMKITAATFLIACLAISGFPFVTAGFYSKDLILGDTLAFFMQPDHAKHLLLPLLGFGTAFMTAFYMFRQYYLTFTGKPRNQEKYDHAKESPWVMTLPLAVLAALAIVGGGFHLPGSNVNIEWFQSLVEKPAVMASAAAGTEHAVEMNEHIVPQAHALETAAAESAAVHGVDEHAAEGGHGHDPLVERAHTTAMILSIILALSGIAVATLFYYRGLTAVPGMLAARLRPLHAFLWNKWYFDEVYYGTFLAGTHAMAGLAWLFDRMVIDFAVNMAGYSGRVGGWLVGLFDNRAIDGAVNGVAQACSLSGGLLGRLQTGRVRTYLLVMIVGVLIVAAALIAAME